MIQKLNVFGITLAHNHIQCVIWTWQQCHDVETENTNDGESPRKAKVDLLRVYAAVCEHNREIPSSFPL